jgi:hypothetical protein
MDKSGTILRNHMISQNKRVQMNPSELLFDSIYENRVLEVKPVMLFLMSLATRIIKSLSKRVD